MNINSEKKAKIQDFLRENIGSLHSVSGGCIADSKLIKTESGKTYFLKTLSSQKSMFLKEANGLRDLRNTNTIRVPEVLLADDEFLLLEYIEQGSKPKHFFDAFGESFADLHRSTNDSFGYFEDNFIGATPQFNIPKDKEKISWPEFYFQKRILAQYNMVEQNGYATKELTKGIKLLENRIEEILKGSDEPPTLLHGDLWGGNYLCDIGGNAVLIDPAVYYGHREADLAMTRMFGGFSPAFYISYNDRYPLPTGWEYRENLYLLYHYLNHLNLFGTGYYSTSVNLLWGYLK